MIDITTDMNEWLPSHVLRLYIWELLKLNTNFALVHGRIPIVPVEDEPLLADSGKTYIIYGFAENNPESGSNEIRRGIMSLRIIAEDITELGKIALVISRALENGDASAEAVNGWSSDFTLDSQKPFLGIRFTSTEVIYSEAGEAPDSEGGPVPGIVNIAYRYVTHQEVELPWTGGLWN